jgi:hypothetical protein
MKKQDDSHDLVADVVSTALAGIFSLYSFGRQAAKSERKHEGPRTKLTNDCTQNDERSSIVPKSVASENRSTYEDWEDRIDNEDNVYPLQVFEDSGGRGFLSHDGDGWEVNYVPYSKDSYADAGYWNENEDSNWDEYQDSSWDDSYMDYEGADEYEADY